MRKANVYVKGVMAGVLQEDTSGYLFVYDDRYMSDDSCRSISLTLPKDVKEHRATTLFPFFFNMLSEGSNRSVLLRTLKLDERDYFGLLLATAGVDTIGAVTLIEI